MTLRLKRRRQRGSLMVLYAAMIMGMVGFAGLAVDVGYMQYTKRRLQQAADAAAMGALREMELGNSDLTAAGRNDASLNGFTNGQNNVTVTVNNPPASGSFSGQNTAVQVIVSKNIPTFFMMAFGQNSVALSAQAVAQTSTSYGSVGGCIFVMDATANGAFTMVGTSNLSTACGAMVNSDSSSAFTMVGTSGVSLASGAQIGVVGPGTAGTGWSLSGNASITNASTGASESPVNIQSFNDPLANVATPTPSGLTVQVNSGGFSDSPHSNTTLSPGIYCGGLDFKGTVNFSGGTYVIAGGGIKINAQATVTGSNSMIYNTSSGSQSWGCRSPSTSDAGSLSFNGGATINLQGATVSDGTSSVGVLFFDDRNITGLSHTINGNSTSTFDGALYFLKGNLTFTGTNKTPGFLYIVADTLTLKGNSNLGNDHSDLSNVSTLAPTATGGGLVQ